MSDTTPNETSMSACVAALRRVISGPVLTSGDEGYADEVTGFDLAVQHCPRVVVGASDSDDVAATIRLAAEFHVPIHVIGGGHGDIPTVQDGVMLTLRRLDTVTVDVPSRSAVVGVGATWHDVLNAATPHGLAAICGSAPAVGVGGFLLGGGLGPVARSCGFGSDHVRGFEIVLADGSVRSISADSDPDLWWALRGGKGGFGVVTSVTVDLPPLPFLYGGGEYYPAHAIPDLLRGFQQLAAGPVPEQLTTSVAVLRMPDRPALPAALRGRTLGHLRVGYVDSAATAADDAERLLAPLRHTLPAPVSGAVGTLPYSEIGTIHNDPTVPSAHATAGMLLRELPPDAVGTILQLAGPDVDTPVAIVEIRHLGGALARPPVDGDAVSGRTASFSVWISSSPLPTPEPTAMSRGAAAVDLLLDALTPWSAPTAVQINFCGSRNTPEQAASAWPPEVHRRLEAIRRSHDPERRLPYLPGAVAPDPA